MPASYPGGRRANDRRDGCRSDRMQGDRQRGERTDQVVELADRWPGELDAVDARDERRQDRGALEAGESHPDARVLAVAERHLVGDVTRDVEPLGIRPAALVAVRGR